MAMPKKTPFTPKEVEQIESLTGYGLTTEKIADFFGICKKTFLRRVKYSPGAKEALTKGRIKANALVAQTCYEMATSGKVPSATFFWLKCRAGWSEQDGPRDEESTSEKDRVYDTEWGKPEANVEEYLTPIQPNQPTETH